MTRIPTGREVLREVGKVTGFTVEKLRSHRCRRRTVEVRARQLAMLLIYQNTEMSVPELGKLMNRTDPNVLRGVRRANELLKHDKRFAILYGRAIKRLKVLASQEPEPEIIPEPEPKPKPEPSKATKNTSKPRTCMMCKTAFDSYWAGERICKRCRSSAAWKEGGSNPFEPAGIGL